MPETHGLSAMMSDLPDLRQIAASLELTLSQRARRRAVLGALKLYRQIRPLVAPHKRTRRDREMEQLTGLKLSTTGRPEGAKGEHYLSDDEIAEFERTGLVKPFRVLSTDDAGKLADRIKTAYDTDELARHTMMTPAIVRELKKRGSFDLDVAGINQHLRMPEFFDVAAHPAIGQRLACLQGDDVLCWRSLFFRKQPGEGGTFWHQNSVFREFASRPKLQPPPGMDPGMAQLTVWMALTDVTKENGTLRLALGTFTDARFEYLYGYALDEMLELLADLPAQSIKDVVTVGLFARVPFLRVQALFDASLALIGDLFADKEIVTIEMKAGEAIIFTSLNMHASHPNTSTDSTRLAWVGRYCPGTVEVYPGGMQDAVSTDDGVMNFPIDTFGSVQAHGTHTSGLNRIATRPTP
jgi:chlorinating enzyme